MQFWHNDVVFALLTVVGLLAAAEAIRAVVAPMRRYGLPASIVGGTLGLVLGPSVMGVLPLYGDVLEAAVYHGLAVVFIAVSLQPPAQGKQGGGARALAFGITAMVALQTAVGLGVILLLGLAVGSHYHPGFGLMLPLGFEQGPGQALSIGSAWEQSGMPDGAQVGLIIAASGFAWSIFVGLPLVAWGKAKGLVGSTGSDAGAVVDGGEDVPVLPAGSLELLSHQVLIIGVVYLATYGVCLGLSRALASAPDLANMIWGFHFMIGALIAMAVRPMLVRLPGGSPVHGGLLGRIAGITVDFATCAALAAVQIGVLAANWLPILLVSLAGGIATLAAVVWLSRRAFPEAAFEHCVLWFGMSTGTLPMGLALLRIIDPELKSPAPVSAVLGSAGSILGVAPIVLLIHPIPISAWATSYPSGGVLALALVTAYLFGTLALWWRFGGLQMTPRTV
jgi:ESS family glutamate:Na+ symporter